MAKQLYDYWFVQFDFPNEEGKPYKSNGGAMKYSSELNREIPENWEISTLDELGSFRNGINYSKDEIGDKTYRIVNVRNISSSSLFLDTIDLDEICLISKSADRYQVGEQDILIARSGTPGATRIIQSTQEYVIFCGFIICFSVNASNQKCLLTYLLKDLETVTKEQSNGSILSNISQDVLKKLLAVVPPSNILESFNSKVLPIWNKIDQTISEINSLKKQRDELLPLLMSGQVSVTPLNSDLSVKPGLK